jgi:hypothetical protein
MSSPAGHWEEDTTGDGVTSVDFDGMHQREIHLFLPAWKA